ncbi:MAG TPA: DNA polymerase III subunit [Planctomycetota bacterium]|nr:DNA polymerase III subunit [Planctomycetota bacterium]
MSWEQLIGQKPARTYLQAALAGGRLAHAFLFAGPAGVGKRTAAYIFAQTVMCHQRPPTGIQPCGDCKSCRWFAARQGALIEHPDFISLLHPPKGDKGVEKLVGDHEPMIKLETVQHFCEKLYRSPMAGSRRVLIIPEAQRLCKGQSESANAFLKTLEEPPHSALIIMTTSHPEGLIETITSRVQLVQFKRLSADEIREGLKRITKKGDEDLATAAMLADGSLGRGLELLGGDLKTWRSGVVRTLSEIQPRNALAFGIGLWTVADMEGKRLFAQKEAAGKTEADEEESDDSGGDDGASDEQVKTEAGWKRYVFRRLLELVEVSFRDALVVASSGDLSQAQPLLLQPDQQKLSQTLAHRFGDEGCQQVLLAIQEALEAVQLYVRGDVVGRALAGKMADCMISPLVPGRP